MNSQQELIDVIKDIAKKQNHTYDTPATVLRVEDDTVWVHIDGGADETPVRKTINCEQGEIVQVRISNGSAFLVGNASAPPTDDKTANVAHFVAEEADEKATEAIEKANAIVQTVREKVDIGASNIQDLSSTMYQNANGVNIYNDTLAVGDSYAHIDGDSFDIKECTTAGQIDDENDGIYASFGREVTVGKRSAGSAVGDYSQVFGQYCIAEGDYSHAEGYSTYAEGDYSHAEGDYSHAEGDYSHAEGWRTTATGNNSHAEGDETKSLGFASHAEGWATKASRAYSHAEGAYTFANGWAAHAEGNGTFANGDNSHAQNEMTIADSDAQTVIGRFNISDGNNLYVLIIGNGPGPDDSNRSDALRVDWNGNVLIQGNVKDMSGANKTPTILTSTTISASTTSYTFSDASITTDSVIDIYDSIFGFAPTGMTVTTGSCTVTFPAQSSSHTIKLFVY